MRDAVTIAVKVQVPTDYLQRDMLERIVSSDPDYAVLNSLFGEDDDRWGKLLLQIIRRVRIVVDDDVRGRAMKNAFEKTTP
jgi:hypothetical protein